MIYMTKKYLNVEFPPGMPMGEKISRMVNWYVFLIYKIGLGFIMFMVLSSLSRINFIYMIFGFISLSKLNW